MCVIIDVVKLLHAPDLLDNEDSFLWWEPAVAVVFDTFVSLSISRSCTDDSSSRTASAFFTSPELST